MNMNTKINSTSRRRFLRGLGIGASGFALGHLLIHPNEAMGQSIEGYLEKVPMEARWRIATNSYVSWQIMCLQEIYDKRGREKFLEHFKKMQPFFTARYKLLVDRFGLTGNAPKSVAAIMSAMLIIWWGSTGKYEIEEVAAEKASLKCLGCAFWNEVQSRKITDDLCSNRCNWFSDSFVKVLNAKLTSTLVKARPLGDLVCEWVIELKA